jgi:hypothetical protein
MPDGYRTDARSPFIAKQSRFPALLFCSKTMSLLTFSNGWFISGCRMAGSP